MTRKQLVMLAGIAGVVSVLVLYWLGGYDFNQRGEKAVSCMVLSLIGGSVAMALAYIMHSELHDR